MDDHTVTGRVLAVLDAVAAHGGEMSLAELTRAVDIPKPTVRRIAMDLCERRILRRCADGGYVLGAHILELGMRAAARLDLRHTATPYVQDLLARSGEIAWIGALSGSTVTLVDSAFGANRAEDVRRGRWPTDLYSPALHATASGRVLLADKPDLLDRLRSRPLRASTPHTSTSWPRVSASLAAVRDTGIAIEREEYVLGYSCVATGLRSPDGELIGILGVTGHTASLSTRRLIQPLLIAARDITRILALPPVPAPGRPRAR